VYLSENAGSAIGAQVDTKIGDDQLLSTLEGKGIWQRDVENAPNEIGRPVQQFVAAAQRQ